MELTVIRPLKDGPTCLTGTQCRVPSVWGQGSSLVRQVPCLGDEYGMIGEEKTIKKVH